MNTEELIVMGVLIVLAGGLMAARHFVHTMEIPAPMATRKVDIGNTEEERPDPLTDRPVVLAEYLAATEDASAQEWMDYRSLVPVIRETLAEGDKQIATLKQRIFAQDRRIAELEVQRSRQETLISTFSVAPARLAELEQRHERMVQNYEDLIATFKEREAAMDKVLLIEHNRLRDLEKRVDHARD